jgi:aminoglycoside phosphotransferase (APT) family kinase protein
VRLPHGYTNATATDSRVVTKRYLGPGASRRRDAEAGCLTRLAGVVPVPELVTVDEDAITVGFVRGAHGQDLLDEHPAEVLGACGRVLRDIHAVRLEDAVLVHGDFGPQNLLLDSGSWQVTAVLDWEWAHPGDPVEDLAWCEWIVRTHHPGQVTALPAFFAAYGAEPPWPQRHEAMLAACHTMLGFVTRWDPGNLAAQDLWRDRIARTQAFA